MNVHQVKPANPVDLGHVRLALLTNFVPPYRIPVFLELQARLREFRVFISTPMESGRLWEPDWGGLPVTVQRTWTIMRRYEHPHGFAHNAALHIPYDTLWQLKSMSPDVVIAGEVGLRTVQAVAYRRWLARQTRLIVWATLSEITELARGRLRRALRSYVLPRADAVLVNGASGRRYVQSFAVPEHRIFTAPQTTELTQFQGISVERASVSFKRLMYCGQLIELKGLHPFVAVLRRWAEQNSDQQVEFWFVGDGPLRGELEGAPRPPNLVFRFVGHVPYRDLAKWYEQAGILVFPTLADEWGLVVNEALAAGVPVLGSLYSQAVEELVREGENGWTFRPDRAEEMSTALERALSLSGSELDGMRVRARRSVRHLTPAFVANQILDAVKFVMADSRTSAALL